MVLFEEIKFIDDILTLKIAIIDNEFDYKYVISNFISGVLKVTVPMDVIADLDSGNTYRMVVITENNSASIILSKEK